MDVYLAERRANLPTHCVRGHEFTPENTRYQQGRARVCRACDARRNRLNRQRNAA